MNDRTPSARDILYAATPLMGDQIMLNNDPGKMLREGPHARESTEMPANTGQLLN